MFVRDSSFLKVSLSCVYLSPAGPLPRVPSVSLHRSDAEYTAVLAWDWPEVSVPDCVSRDLLIFLELWSCMGVSATRVNVWRSGGTLWKLFWASNQVLTCGGRCFYALGHLTGPAGTLLRWSYLEPFESSWCSFGFLSWSINVLLAAGIGVIFLLFLKTTNLSEIGNS